MGAPPAAAEPRARWWGPLLGLLALAFLPHLVTPVSPVTILLIPALAACAIIGWQAGASVFLMMALVAWSAWMLTQAAPGSSAAFTALSRGWSLVLTASFGLVCWAAPRRPFLLRALVAIGMTLTIAAGMLLTGVPTASEQVTATVATEIVTRRDALLATMRSDLTGEAELGALGPDSVEVRNFLTMAETALNGTTTAVTTVFPALLAVESLAVLALAWALFHRLNRLTARMARGSPTGSAVSPATRLIALPLGPLRDFRFNDQMVWGLALALTALVLPTMEPFRGVGWNLLVFFGCLYTVRGLGVVAWFLHPPRGATFAALVLAALILPVVAALALGVLGVGDTWADWRHRVRPSTLT